MSFLKNRKVAGIVSILLVVMFAVAFYMSYIVSRAEATREPNDHVHTVYSWAGIKGGAKVIFHKGVSDNCGASHSGSHQCSCSSSCGC